VTESIGPSYQLVADDIRAKIGAGEYAVGSPIPSTSQLMDLHQVSSTVVRKAVELLKVDGVLIGHSGKAVFVRAAPEEAAQERQDAEALSQEAARLRDEIRRLAERVESLESADVKGALTRLELNLMDLYGKLGFDYPHDDQATEDRSTGGGTAAHGNLA
jgi:DNA-binding GntR family transcriptional regulator